MLTKIRDYRMQRKVRKWNRLLAQENRVVQRRDKEFHYQDSNFNSIISGHARHPKKGS